MKIFISWSGERSNKIANILKTWIENCFQNVEAFMSQHDIDPGSRWAAKLNEELKNTNFGIICLTPENLHQDWILYEAGALAKDTDISRVVPIRWQLSPGDIGQPLSQFNNLAFDEDGLLALNKLINKNIEKQLFQDKIKTTYDAFLPEVKAQMKEVPVDFSGSLPAPREDRAILEEILQYTKNQFNFSTRLAKIRKTSDKIIREMNKFDLNAFIQDCLEGMQETVNGMEHKFYLERIKFAATTMQENFPDLRESVTALLDTVSKIGTKPKAKDAEPEM